MAKAKRGYYAVKVGRDGPKVYSTWEETEQVVKGFPGSVHKKFPTMESAEEWIKMPESTRVIPLSSSNRQMPKAVYTPSSSQQSVSWRSEATRTPLKRSASPGSLGYSRPAPSTPRASSVSGTSPEPTGTSANPIEIPSSPIGPSQASNSTRISSSAGGTGKGSPVQDASVIAGSSDPTMPEIELSDEQHRILDQVMMGKSVFFTGSAGTGKSVLMRRIIQDLRSIYGAETVAVTASTVILSTAVAVLLAVCCRHSSTDTAKWFIPSGIASLNVGGVTLHSWACIGLGKQSSHILIRKIRSWKAALENWTQTRTLIIDEISMVDGSLFDKLEILARSLRERDEPFGGIQLVISGDFFQLPPVPDRHDGANVPITYAFDAESWERCVPYCYELTQVFRQKEQSFIDTLNKMRYGDMDEKAISQFYRLSRAVMYDDDIEPAQLYPRKDQVESANNERLMRLDGTTMTFTAVDTPGVDIRGKKLTKEETAKSLDRMVALKQVSLRKGAQVMLIKNVVQGHLINGSLGKVVDFQTPLQARENHTSIAQVDKGGSSRDATAQPGEASEGSMSTSQSRLDSSASFDEEEDFTEEHNGSRDTEKIWPIVEFTNGRRLMLEPAEFSVMNLHGEIEAKRKQVPLILAWALSIHKSQGQTLERVKIDLGEIFEKGQAYVALSRATSIQTLQVLNFRPEKVMAHQRVLQWSKTFAKHVIHEADDDLGDEGEQTSSENEQYEDCRDEMEEDDN